MGGLVIIIIIVLVMDGITITIIIVIIIITIIALVHPTIVRGIIVAFSKASFPARGRGSCGVASSRPRGAANPSRPSRRAARDGPASSCAMGAARAEAAAAALALAAAALWLLRRRARPGAAGRRRSAREAAVDRAEAAIRASKWRLPQAVVLLRHGESLGNIRENAYRVIPDWCIPLTEEGKMQARRASKDIVDLIGKRKVVIYYSPYTRAVETLDVLLDFIPEDQIAFMQEEPRIREQEFANFQTPQMPEIKKERNRYGRFFYRFPDGESGADVYDRVSSFFETLFRQFKRSPISDMDGDDDYVLLLVSHGLTIRLFVMKFLGFNVSYFEKLRNPRNCTPLVMRRKKGSFVYELDADSWRSMGVLNPCEQCVPVDSFQFPVHYCVSPSLQRYRAEHRKAYGDTLFAAQSDADTDESNEFS